MVKTVLTRFRHDGGRVGSITESRIPKFQGQQRSFR